MAQFSKTVDSATRQRLQKRAVELGLTDAVITQKVTLKNGSVYTFSGTTMRTSPSGTKRVRADGKLLGSKRMEAEAALRKLAGLLCLLVLFVSGCSSSPTAPDTRFCAGKTRGAYVEGGDTIVIGAPDTSFTFRVRLCGSFDPWKTAP